MIKESFLVMLLAVVLGFIFLAGFYIYLHTDFSYKENKQKENKQEKVENKETFDETGNIELE